MTLKRKMAKLSGETLNYQSWMNNRGIFISEKSFNYRLGGKEQRRRIPIACA